VKDVGRKPETARRAVAVAILRAPGAAIALLRDGRTEKGDALAAARVAGILAAKRTPELIPLCHPLPIDHAELTFELRSDAVTITATVSALARTGVEMEALTAASVAALTLYDMLKPHADPGALVIAECRLVLKEGGKSRFAARA
jgi:molybdenum cofactor biosynthesis protein MoaC